MKRRIRVRAMRRKEVDLDKLAFALLRLVEQLSPTERKRWLATHDPASADEPVGPVTGDGS
jgi:hypothetical protein